MEETDFWQRLLNIDESKLRIFLAWSVSTTTAFKQRIFFQCDDAHCQTYATKHWQIWRLQKFMIVSISMHGNAYYRTILWFFTIVSSALSSSFFREKRQADYPGRSIHWWLGWCKHTLDLIRAPTLSPLFPLFLEKSH